MRKERMAYVTKLQKVYQLKELACFVKGEVQERRLRRTEKEEVAHVTKP